MMTIVARSLLVLFGMLLPPCPLLVANASQSGAPSVLSKANNVTVANAPPLQISDTECRSFEATFQTISEQAHVLIVSEGAPLNPILTDKQASELRQKLSTDATTPLLSAVTLVAGMYDYDVEQTDSQTFLLRKRYSDPNDLPCVTFDEINYSLRAILQIVDSYAPSTPIKDRFSDAQLLLDSFKPEQKEQAKRSLPIAALNPDQRQVALGLMEDVVIEPRVIAMRNLAAKYFPTLRHKDTVFQWVDATLIDQSHIKTFGFEGRFGWNGVLQELPIAGPFKIKSRGGYSGIRINAPVQSGTAQQSPFFLHSNEASQNNQTHSVKVDITETFDADPTIPTDLDREFASGMMANRLSSTKTLREAAQQAEALPTGYTDDGLSSADRVHAVVEEAVADKPVSVFGAQHARTVRHLMQTLADLYGLQLLVSDHQHYALSLPLAHEVQSPAEVAVEIKRLTPLPLMHAMKGQTDAFVYDLRDKQQKEQGESPAAPLNRSQQQARTAFQARSTVSQAQTKVVDNYYFPAARRLIALAEPKAPKPDSPPVPVESLAPESDRLIALMLLSGEAMYELINLQKFVPPDSLIYVDTARIQIFQTMQGDRVWYAIGFGHLQEDGKFNPDAMSAVAIYHSKQ